MVDRDAGKLPSELKRLRSWRTREDPFREDWPGIAAMLRDAGLVGNTHIPFADMNNVEVAVLVSEFLGAHDLDGFAR